MDTTGKREAALNLLAETGIWRSNYAPPITRLMWRLGFNVPPPHFARFISVTVVYALSFAALFGLILWLDIWSHQDYQFFTVFLKAGLAGLLFGIAMAGYYSYGRYKYHLPRWDSLGSE